MKHFKLSILAIASLCTIQYTHAFNDADWSSMTNGLPGANSYVSSSVTDGMGNLYVGGDFTIIGNTYANRIAKWDGTSWTSLGSGMNNTVSALEIVNGELYAGGQFTTAGGQNIARIARWDGTTWHALGSGIDGAVHDIIAFGTSIYISGIFTQAGGVSAANIARWDGATWSSVGGGLNQRGDRMVVHGSDLFVGGRFTTAGSINANYIARWNGSSWSALGAGTSSWVQALASNGTDLFVGGAFIDAGGVTVNRIARWDGTNWNAMASGVGSVVYTLKYHGTDLYVGGSFSAASGVTSQRIAKWNGSSWQTFATGMTANNDYVSIIEFIGTNMIAGGNFNFVGGNTAQSIAKYDGSSWASVTPGMDRGVYALASSGTDLYVGGWFSTINGLNLTRVAKWDGSSWSALGSGVNGPIRAMVVIGTDLYVGGEFTSAGGVPVNNIAKWNGSVWSALGGGVNDEVRALAVSGTSLYVGGEFTAADGSSANHVAKWDGNNWAALGSGVLTASSFGDYVSALAVNGTDLYVGGLFDVAGGVASSRIAKWDGTSWSSMDGGVSGIVNDIVIFNNEVIIAAGNIIYRWEFDMFWSGIGYANYQTLSLAVHGTKLYAAGDFTTIAGVSATRIAEWNGSGWSALGSGIDQRVLDMVVIGSDLYAGGTFHAAGTTFSPMLVKGDLASSTIAVSPVAILGGPYDQLAQLMSDDLRSAGLIPLTEPYSALGYAHVNGGGGETTTATALAVTGNNAIVDWVVVELRSTTAPYGVLATRSALVQRDGDVVGTSGSGPVFFNQPPGNYRVSVRHRNHLGAMTNTGIALGTTTTLVDFSVPSTATYGTNAQTTVGTRRALWAGDCRGHGDVKYTGTDNDRDMILQLVGGVTPTNTVSGYHREDVNMDGIVRYTGTDNDRDIILENIGGVVPTNVVLEQLP